MRIADTNVLAASSYLTNNPMPQPAAGTTEFSVMLSQLTSTTSLTAANATSASDMVREVGIALRAALRQSGIPVPPALRIEINSDGPTLNNDPRAKAFHAMLTTRPALQAGLAGIIGNAESTRAAAFASASADFLQHAKDPRRASAVLDRYTHDHPAPVISATYDGFDIGTQEKSGDSWRPVKTEKEFAWELAMAYQQYAVDDQALFDSLLKATSSSSPAKAKPEPTNSETKQTKSSEAAKDLAAKQWGLRRL